MKTVKKKQEIKSISNRLKMEGKTIGLVPTMGYLHDGHVSLIKKAKRECDAVIMSVFVNPIQFGPKEDFKSYPRDLKRDEGIAEKYGVDYIFSPTASQMYLKDHKAYVNVSEIEDIMCGKSRKDHFRGVCTVVLKLFNIIEPSISYFGLKDYQQFVIIKKMVSDLDLPVSVRPVETVREKDGLALSSRNKYLSEKERKDANILYKTLKEAKEKTLSYSNDIYKVKKESIKMIMSNKHVKKIDYFDIRDAKTLAEIEKPKKGQSILIAAAVYIGKTRLIDNTVFNF